MTQSSIQECAFHFSEHFGLRPDMLAWAPGRLEVLGNHTDYNEGWVLSVAVDRLTSVALAINEGTECEIVSSLAGDGMRKFDLERITDPLPHGDWTNYVRGVCHELIRAGCPIGGFQAFITTEVPLSAGMSSSASLEIALLKGLDSLFGLALSNEQMARIGQGCENNYIGANTGLMDQFTSLHGRAGCLVVSEYRGLGISHLGLPEGFAFVVINSGVKHDLSEEYSERRAQCEAVAKLIGSREDHVKSLRDVNQDTLKKWRHLLSEEAYRRALHVVGENERVDLAKQYLTEGDVEAFGELLYQSHQSSKKNFENSCKQLDTLVQIAADSAICLGARLSGGGFGGITIHLVRESEAEKYAEYVCQKYAKITGSEVEHVVTSSGDGADVITIN